MNLAWAVLDTPVGPVSVGCSPAGVAQVRFGHPPGAGSDPTPAASPASAASPARAADSAPAVGLDPAADPTLADEDGLCGDALTQLAEYFSGRRRRFDLPLDWSATSRLQRQVLGELHESIGFGETISYGALARQAGVEGDSTSLPARAVGQIMGSNPIPLIVPCHRVVAADGLGGFSGGTGLEVKRWLLVFEGALPPTLDWEPTRLPAGYGSAG